MVLFCAAPSLLSAQDRFTQAGIDSAAIQTKVNKLLSQRDSMLAANAARKKQDSINRVNLKIRQQFVRDSIIQARNAKRIADSIARVEAKNKLIREQQIRDSIAAANKKRINDSLAYVKFKSDSLQQRQRAISDSIIARRKFVTDSTKIARDSIKKIREALTKYRNSKQYKDSVELVKAAKKDSIKEDRITKLNALRERQKQIADSTRASIKHYSDSVASDTKRIRDSLNAIAKANNDKLIETRKKYNDSVSVVRQKRLDSLKIKREEREKKLAGKSKENTKEKKDLKLAIALHEKKTEEWTNDKLLKRKWIITRRIYQNTVTRYNSYYHAKKRYDESVQKIVKENKDDFTKPINLYPYDNDKAGNAVSGNMDSVIKKASYSTQIHDPRSKWFDNLYLLMAKAYFLKGDYDGAITTCTFIINEYKETPKKSKRSIDTSASIATKEKGKKLITFFKHKPIRNEAILLLINGYIQTEQYGEALTMITLLEKDKVLPKKYLPDLMLSKAYLSLKQNNRDEAIKALEIALKSKVPSKQKSRAQFLLAQLYALNGNYDKSTAAYKKSFYKKNSPEMDFYTRLHIAENAAKGGGDLGYAVSLLNKIIKDPKYVKFKAQALVTLALIQKNDNVDKAIATLLKSIADPENKNASSRAVAFSELGSIYFEQKKYVQAKNCYDTAINLGTDPPIDHLEEISYKRNVLIDIVLYVSTIHEQDSLLALSNLTEKEKRAIVKKEIDRLNKERENEAMLKVETMKPIGKNNTGTSNTSNTSTWYFTKPELVEQGLKDFKQKWGTRKLQDNWRRVGANDLLANSGDEDSSENGENKAASFDLWSKIPSSQAQKDSCHLKIMNAFYGLGLAYYSQLSDYPNSNATFDTLLQRYPKTKYKPEVYYAEYLNYGLLKNEEKSTYYKNLLLKEFPSSELAKLTSNSNFKADQNRAMQSDYENTYTLYKEDKFEEALSEISKVEKNNPLMAKYKLMEALCHAGLKKLTQCKSGLMAVISEYPESSEQRKAQEVLAYISKYESEMNNDSSSKKISDSLDKNMNLKSSEAFGQYIPDPTGMQLVMIYLKNADNKTTAFKAGISDYNLLRYNVEEYATGLNYISTNEALVTVKTFPTVQAAKKYLNDLKKEKSVFSQLKSSDFELSIITQQNFIELLKTKDINGYQDFYKKNY